MGGGIAYLADMVGKKLGKKRLSVFGLRPRQTAALGTICLGVLITMVTISFALVVSSGTRHIWFHGNEIRRELTKLENELSSRSSRNAELAKNNNDLLKKITSTSVELRKRQADLQKAQASLQTVNAQITSLQLKIGILTQNAQKKESALTEANKQLQNIKTSLSQVTFELHQNSLKLSNVQKVNQEVLVQNQKLVEQNEELQTTQAKLQKDKTSLEKDLTKIKQDVEKAQSDLGTAQSELDKSHRELSQVEKELSSAQTDLTNTKAELVEKEGILGVLKGISDVSRKEALTYRMGEEVARLKVPANVGPNGANGALTLLLRRARVAAQQRGATTAAVYDHEQLTREQIERPVLKQLTSSSIGRVVIATAQFNAFRGESVSLELAVLPDKKVYSGGQVVAETVIEANRGDLSVYQQLSTFLQDKVSQKAKADGMIPVVNSDVPLGQVSQADVLQLIQQLHAVNRPIRLYAHAIGDTYAADSLKLEFRLR